MVEKPTETVDFSDEYELDADELAFFKAQTKIQDDVELKNHIAAVRAKAYAFYPYPCIKRLGLKITHVPAYRRVLQLSKERKDAILLDVGCCLGYDLRKAVTDGWPAENGIGFELRKEFWSFGYDLFLDTPETFPAGFIAGDIFDPSMIAPHAPFYTADLPLLTAQAPPELKSLTSLTPLQGRVSAIFACAFFHLFDEAKQLQAARQLASLLSPLPGSVIFGAHSTMLVNGMRGTSLGFKVFCHSPESWKEVWDGIVFEKGTISVEVGVKLVDGVDKLIWMSWSVTRL